jgi:DNA-binding Xre family transcriptional regulator
MKTKLLSLLSFYGIGLADLPPAVEQYQPASISWHVLGKLAQNNLRRVPTHTLADLCQIFGLTSLSQLLEFDSVESEAPAIYLEFPPASVRLISYLPQLMQDQWVDVAKLRQISGMNYSTVARWCHDFSHLNAIGFNTLDALGDALDLKTIDQLIRIEPVGRFQAEDFSVRSIQALLNPDCAAPFGRQELRLPLPKTA